MRHLGELMGELIGGPETEAIIALSTSEVFQDPTLLGTFWGVSAEDIDSGFQGHLYTRKSDALVVRVSTADMHHLELVSRAIDVNADIWLRATGIQLATSTSPLVVAADRPFPGPTPLPSNVSWYAGGLLEAACRCLEDRGGTLLAFVPDMRLLQRLGDRVTADPALLGRIRTTTRLMDKNRAMAELCAAGVPCARTFPVEAEAGLATLGSLPADVRYVFKPAGGAAGIGVRGNDGRGLSAADVREHVATLGMRGELPARFQVQEFVRGELLGMAAHSPDGATLEVMEVHHQILDEEGRFVGARWDPTRMDTRTLADEIFRRVACLGRPWPNIIGLDVIDGKVIEVNPRLTAAGPIAHVLRLKGRIARHRRGRCVERIDLRTDVRIHPEDIRSGRVRDVAEEVRRRTGVLVLPQGLDPFGASRVVFLDDDEACAGQREFREGLRR